MTYLSSIALTALLLSAQRGPESEQTAERVDWWPKIETVETMLAKEKWKAARKQAARVMHFVISEAWSGRDLDRVLAKLSLQHAVAEMNLGKERAALWHWWAAVNLEPGLEGHDLTAYGRAASLSANRLRLLQEMPPDYDRLDDLEMFDLEPPRFAEVAPPDIVTNAAAARTRQPDILVEAILDKSGVIRQPVLMTEDAHPILVYVAFDWLSKMPPAIPARLQGRAVDSLQLLNVSFKIERGQILMGPPDN